jgi:hypothetical protein
MPAVARMTDKSTGHGCFPPTAMVLTPVSKTFFNGKLAGSKSSSCQFATHSCGVTVHPQSTRIPSSSAGKTYIEGNLAVRIGDSIGDGDAIAQGSSNSFIE